MWMRRVKVRAHHSATHGKEGEREREHDISTRLARVAVFIASGGPRSHIVHKADISGILRDL